VYETGKQTNAAFRARIAKAPFQTYHPESSNVFGEPRITSYHVLDRYPVVAIMSFNKNNVLAEWRASTIRNALTITLFMVLVSALTWLLLQQVRLLDHKVHERTALLTLANRFLEQEIEERKHVETNLLEHQRKMEQMSSDLSLAEDRERGRIAGELHDQVGQRLILAKIKLDELTSDEVKPDRQKMLLDTVGLLEQSLHDIRTLTFQMRPPILANAGLLSALQWLGSELQRDYGLEVKFDFSEYDTSQEQLKFEISSAMFQIIRELLLNVVKHAGVQTAWLTVQLSPQLLQVRVTDNGRGFDPYKQTEKNSRTGGFGLYNIQLKIRNLGGSCQLDAAPGMGSCVTLSLPLKAELFKVQGELP
jgi:signal transduction histidine kinase